MREREKEYIGQMQLEKIQTPYPAHAAIICCTLPDIIQISASLAEYF